MARGNPIHKLRDDFALLTIEDLHELLPGSLKVTVRQLTDLVKQAGTWRDIGGAMILTPEDVDDFFAYIRAKPTDQGMSIGKIMSASYGPHDLGYVAVIGNALDHEEPVYIGWAPRANGLRDLLWAVQFGSPLTCDVMGILAATPEELAAFKATMSGEVIRPGSSWYVRGRVVNTFISQLQRLQRGEIPDQGAAVA